jgi:hypothetical protein
MDAREAAPATDAKAATTDKNRTAADLIVPMQSSPYREIEMSCPLSNAGARRYRLMAWLLDTNILSELRRLNSELNVVAFVDSMIPARWRNSRSCKFRS